MSTSLIIVALFSFISTGLGGLFALRYQRYLPSIMGFAAGVLLGVVFFDIFPEIFELIESTHMPTEYIMIALVCGFLLFHILEKTLLIHHHHEEVYGAHKHPNVGVASALALIGHSFMDGIAIGLGFQVSPAIGVAVAIAVIAHDFTDGMNVVTLMLSHKNTAKKSKIFLLIDTLAPIAGIISTLFFAIPDSTLVLYLWFFAGFLLYIGASDILPEAHSEKSSFSVIALTILGTCMMFLVSLYV